MIKELFLGSAVLFCAASIINGQDASYGFKTCTWQERKVCIEMARWETPLETLMVITKDECEKACNENEQCNFIAYNEMGYATKMCMLLATCNGIVDFPTPAEVYISAKNECP